MKLPSGSNQIETDFLVYRGHLYESGYRKTQPTLYFCRLEPKNKVHSNGSVKVVVQKLASPSSYWLGVSERLMGSEIWSAVQATRTGAAFVGKGNLDPHSYIRLKIEPHNRASLKFRFETGPGKIGQRTKALGSFKNLRCYQP